MIDLKLLPREPVLKFDSLLPVFNWYYPFYQDTGRQVDPKRLLNNLRTDGVRRRALYVHVPFCETICSFCPFFRSGFRQRDEIALYHEAMLREIEWKGSFPALRGAPIDCIAVGGGTPSLLNPEEILALGAKLDEHFDLSRVREFTFELEAKSVTREKLETMRAIGVNRVSFGVQTFSPLYRDLFRLTATLEDIHLAAQWSNELFPSTNVDMIYTMAGQTLDDVLSDAEKAMALGTTTVDFYPLNYMSAQPTLHRALRRNGLVRLSPATKVGYRIALDEYMKSCGWVAVNGYGYRKAAYAESRPLVDRSHLFLYHDILYGYLEDEVVGIGAGAISQLRGCNLFNAVDRHAYIGSSPDHNGAVTAYGGRLSHEKGVVYFPYRGELCKERIDWSAIPKETHEAFERARDGGLIEDHGTIFALTFPGWLFYVNLIYYLTPESGKRWITERIAWRLSQGREPEKLEIFPEQDSGGPAIGPTSPNPTIRLTADCPH